MEYRELQNKYHTFVYKSYEKYISENQLTLHFNYDLVGEKTISFTHKVSYEYVNHKLDTDRINKGELESFVFHIGLVETINYWKLACPKKVLIQCGQISHQQRKWWKKLYYHGLGEFIYLNNMAEEVTEESFVDFVHDETTPQREFTTPIHLETRGNLIPVGGGKDSVVTLEVLKESHGENIPFAMSPPIAAYDCIQVAGYDKYLLAKRIFAQEMMEMNKQGYLNGHVPFSAILAFISSLGAAMIGRRYIPLSNERSANEPSVIGTTFNHQYSKSYEFEKDFDDYLHHYLSQDISYFSLLRPLYEIEIGHMFSRYKAYHKVYRSCNRGKTTNTWCGVCPKCLFVYIILSPYIKSEDLVQQFGKDLFQDESLIPVFDELIGIKETKPFECVGTIWEVRHALNQRIKQYGDKELPVLLAYYKANKYDQLDDSVTEYEEGDLLPEEHRLALESEMKSIE